MDTFGPLDREYGFPVEKTVARRIFKHHLGFEVEEAILKWNGKFKVVWIRLPMTEMSLDDKENAFVHADFSDNVLTCSNMEVNYANMRLLEELQRRKVSEKFDKYWNPEG